MAQKEGFELENRRFVPFHSVIEAFEKSSNIKKISHHSFILFRAVLPFSDL